MNIQNIKLNSINQVKFSGSQTQPKPEQVVQEEKKVPKNYDTARAYASYGIIKDKKNQQETMPLNDVYLSFKENTDNEIVVTMLNVNNTDNEEIKQYEGIFDIYKNRVKGKISMAKFYFNSSNFSTFGVTNSDGTLETMSAPVSLENLAKCIVGVKYVMFDTSCDEETFEIAKQNIKNYYQVNWNDMKAHPNKYFEYDSMRNLKTFEDVRNKLDKISFKTYNQNKEKFLNPKTTVINVELPKEILNDEERLLKIKEVLFNDLIVKGKYQETIQ